MWFSYCCFPPEIFGKVFTPGGGGPGGPGGGGGGGAAEDGPWRGAAAVAPSLRGGGQRGVLRVGEASQRRQLLAKLLHRAERAHAHARRLGRRRL